MKPGEVILPEHMQIGMKYIAAVPLREYKWKAISACCGSYMKRDIIEEIELEEGEEAPPITQTCTKCGLKCDKRWKTISKLIPSLARTDDQQFHLMDEF